MNERHIDEILAKITPPEPSAEAPSRALGAALTAFDEKIKNAAQGSAQAGRPTDITFFNDVRRYFMERRKTIILLAGSASALAIAAVALSYNPSLGLGGNVARGLSFVPDILSSFAYVSGLGIFLGGVFRVFGSPWRITLRRLGTGLALFGAGIVLPFALMAVTPNMVAIAAYLAGLGFIGYAFANIRKSPRGKTALRFGYASTLLALPFVLNVSTNTLSSPQVAQVNPSALQFSAAKFDGGGAGGYSGGANMKNVTGNIVSSTSALPNLFTLATGPGVGKVLNNMARSLPSPAGTVNPSALQFAPATFGDATQMASNAYAPRKRAENPLDEWRSRPDTRRMEMEKEKAERKAAPQPSEPAGISAEAVAPAYDASGSIAPIAPPVDIVVDEYKDFGRDKFEEVEENTVIQVAQEPVSTFSIDVDTASYAFMRGMLNAGVLPQKDSVRIEELINYFDYDYALPEKGGHPFKPAVAVYDSPWKKGNKLVHIGIKGYDLETKPRSNIVFLVDTSGSMNTTDKLPLLISSLKMSLDSMDPDDTVGIVTYAGSAGVALEPTRVSDRRKIERALDGLYAGGSTAGAEGIRTAYDLAEDAFIKGGNNRIVIATDGDFNVGITNPRELQGFVERKRDEGIYLSVLGFGQGNYNDHIMQTLAQNGNGNAAYIDNLNEARKVLVDEASSTLFTIAKDVKIQVEFNPETVSEYRLIGYETRHLEREDFNNDAVDAGEVGAGHTVTAIYEITPVGAPKLVDDLRYGKKEAAVAQEAAPAKTAGEPNEYAFLKIRYKQPDSDTSVLMERPITTSDEVAFEAASDDVRFAAAVAGFGQLLKGSKFAGRFGYDDVIEIATAARGKDEFGYRSEFVNLVRLAKSAADMGRQR